MSNPLFGKRPKAIFVIPELKPIEKLKFSIRAHERAGGYVTEGALYKYDGWERMWFDQDKKLHREDGPAHEEVYYDPKTPMPQPRYTTLELYDKMGKYDQVDRKWYSHGVLHREDGPAVMKFDGTREWYLNGLPHREDGPAVVYLNGDKEWHQNGVLHREDGPAIVYASPTTNHLGEPRGWQSQCEFYLHGEFCTAKEFITKLKGLRNPL